MHLKKNNKTTTKAHSKYVRMWPVSPEGFCYKQNKQTKKQIKNLKFLKCNVGAGD